MYFVPLSKCIDTGFHIKLYIIILSLIRSKPRIMASSLSMLPFRKTNDLDIAYNIESNENTSININTDCLNHYDQANLCEIDPDINYIGEENAIKCNKYYDINNFNMNKLSLFRLNIRSLPDHFKEMVTYLECLNTKFKIIAFTET